MSTTVARFIDGIPTISSDSQRDLLIPTPDPGQKVYRTDLLAVQRYDGTQWVTDGPFPVEAGELSVYNSRYERGNVFRYGAIADGDSHPLSARYSTLAAAQAVYPFATSLTQEIDWAALQACVNACFGAPGSSNGSANPERNRPMTLGPGIFRVNDTVIMGGVVGFKLTGAGRNCTTIRQHGAGKTILMMDAVSYGTTADIQFYSTVAILEDDGALVDIDYTGTYTNALKPQQMTFRDCTFHGGGTGLAQVGVQICRQGSSAQGDNIVFFNCLALQCKQAGYRIGGPALAQNALNLKWIGGDIQGCSYGGIVNFGGSFTVYGTTCENQGDNARQVKLDGADFINFGSTSPCVIYNVRSESMCLTRGPIDVYNGCETYATDVITWSAESHFDLGRIIRGTSNVATTDGRAYIAMTADLTSYRPADDSGDLTNIDDAAATYTVNQWAGKVLVMLYPNGFTEAKLVASNTATRIVLATPLTFDYHEGPTSVGQYKISGITDATEPDWTASTRPTYQEGSATMVQGSKTLVVGGGLTMTAPMVGYGIIVNGAGEDGGPLLSTIASFTDATHVELADEAVGSVEDETLRFGPMVTDGDISWLWYEFDGIHGARVVHDARLSHGRINPAANWKEIRNCVFSRKDWLPTTVFSNVGATEYATMIANNEVKYGTIFDPLIDYPLIAGEADEPRSHVDMRLSGIAAGYREITNTGSPHTLSITDAFVVVDSTSGAVSITLPTSGIKKGQRYRIHIKAETSAITVTPSSGTVTTPAGQGSSLKLRGVGRTFEFTWNGLLAGSSIWRCDQDTSAASAVTRITSADSPYTLLSSDTTVLVDTSSGNVTVTLPASPVVGRIVTIKKTTSDANTLTIGRNTKNIEGAAADLTTIAKDSFTLQFESAALGWWII